MRISMQRVAVLLTALIALGVTYGAWQNARSQTSSDLRTRFEFRMEEIAQALRDRMLDYETVLRGGAGMIGVLPGLRQADWSRYIESLQLQIAYPGILSVGYAPYAAGGAAVQLIAPLDAGNRRSLGFDMFSERERRAAMERARDSGEPAATAGLTLVQDRDSSPQPGFLVYVPVYRGAPGGTVGTRRAALEGFVFGSFRIAELIRGTVGGTPGIRLQLHDVSDRQRTVLLFESAAASPDSAYASARTLEIRGRRWVLEGEALTSFSLLLGGDRPLLVLAGGLVTTILLTGLVWSFLNTRAHARELARRMLATREELDRFRAAVDRHRDTMLMVDANRMRIVYANEGACRSLGYAREELVGASPEIVFADRNTADLTHEYGRLAATDEGTELERATFRRKDGGTFPVEISREVMRTSSGLFILGVARDITERRAAERTLKLSEERLELALTSSALALFDWDLKTNLVHLGKEWMVILGGTPQATVTPIQKLEALVHPDDRPAMTAHVRRLLKGEIPSYRIEHRVRRLDGGWRWIESAARVSERDAAGRAIRVTGTNADVSERRALGEMKNAFIANVSHELRTPLTSIIASLELMREGSAGDLPPQARHFVEMAAANGERLSELINDILDLEKVESGQMRLDTRDVAVGPLLEGAASLNASYASKYGIRFDVRAPASSLALRADLDRLQQVLTNLLSNAAKFSPSGSAVVIEARGRGDRVVLSVADSGPGIPEDFKARLFGKFEQANPQRGGSGLGLALCKAMTERMGGRIWCESAPGRGATFFVELPAAAPA